MLRLADSRVPSPPSASLTTQASLHQAFSEREGSSSENTPEDPSAETSSADLERDVVTSFGSAAAPITVISGRLITSLR